MSALNVERREAFVEEEVRELCLSEVRCVGGRRCTPKGGMSRLGMKCVRGPAIVCCLGRVGRDVGGGFIRGWAAELG